MSYMLDIYSPDSDIDGCIGNKLKIEADLTGVKTANKSYILKTRPHKLKNGNHREQMTGMSMFFYQNLQDI